MGRGSCGEDRRGDGRRISQEPVRGAWLGDNPNGSDDKSINPEGIGRESSPSWSRTARRCRRRMDCPPRLFLLTRNTHRAHRTRKMTGAKKRVRATSVRTTNWQPWTSTMTSTNWPLRILTWYVLAPSAPASLTAVPKARPSMLMLGIEWLMGTITRQADARTGHLYEHRGLVDRNGSTRSMKLTSNKHSVDSSSGEA